MKKQSVCMDCEFRKVGCHSVCEKYISEKAEYENLKDSIRKIQQGKYDIDDFKVTTVIATRKRYNKKVK